MLQTPQGIAAYWAKSVKRALDNSTHAREHLSLSPKLLQLNAEIFQASTRDKLQRGDSYKGTKAV